MAKEKLTIVKVGGAVVEDPDRLAQLLTSFSNIEGRKLMVHGGGRLATQTAARLGIETTMVNGRRVTDADMLQVVTMVYGGLVNKNIVAQLQARGVNAIGLTGADLNIIRSRKRPPADVDYGFVGDVESVGATMLSTLIETGTTPVLAPLTHDGHGTMLNTNADTIASATAMALAPLYDTTLVFSFEKNGVLADPEDPSTTIPIISRADYKRLLVQGTISGGMIPKLDAAFKAIDAGVSRVVITLATALDGRHGTTIVP